MKVPENVYFLPGILYLKGEVSGVIFTIIRLPKPSGELYREGVYAQFKLQTADMITIEIIVRSSRIRTKIYEESM